MGKLDNLLQAEMTRKQFLLTLVSAIVGLTGVASFLGAFTKTTPKPTENPGYGQRGYGP